jgi:hypothetical protein
MSVWYSALIYGGTAALGPLALVNPIGGGLKHEYKMAIVYGLIPAMVKMASMAGAAQLGTKMVLGAFVGTIIAHLALRAASEDYKTAIENPGESKPMTAILSWVGITAIYTIVLLLGMSFLKENRFNTGAKINRGGGAPTPA